MSYYTGPCPWTDADWLYHEYVELDKTIDDIAEAYGCSHSNIKWWLWKHHIKKDRYTLEYLLQQPWARQESLYREYVTEEQSISSIAREHQVPLASIHRLLDYFKIPVRHTQARKYTDAVVAAIAKQYYEDGESANDISKAYNTSASCVAKILRKHGYQTRTLAEAQFNACDKVWPADFNDPDLLYHLHWEENLSCKAIAGRYGVDPGTVRRRMHELGLLTKNNSEAKRGLMTGATHPNWKNGKTPLSGLLRTFFQVNQVPHILARDHYTCQICGAAQTELHVHHIEPFAEITDTILAEHPTLSPEQSDDRQALYKIITADSRFLDESNLITLCRDCHFFYVHNYQRKTTSSQAPTFIEGEGSETIPSGSTS